MKGFHRLIPLMKLLPEVDLRIAGTGPFERELRRMRPPGCPTSTPKGFLGGPGLARLFHGARAVVVPVAVSRDVRLRRPRSIRRADPGDVQPGGGPCTRPGVLSGGGLGYQTDGELLLALRRLVHDDDLRDDLAHRGYAVRTGENGPETAHLDRYFNLIHAVQAGRPSAPRPRFLSVPLRRSTPTEI